MSQPRRRRRRRRGGASRSSQGGQEKKQQKAEQPKRERAEAGPGARRRRRRGRGGARNRTTSPASSEDLVRAPKKAPPATLTAPHDGTTLEQVIGELQSTWGVPQHPQEYRLVLKVPEERDGGRGAVATEEAVDPPDEQTDADKPRREKAPGAPRVGANGEAKSPAAPSRRRRGRRRRKKKGPPK